MSNRVRVFIYATAPAEEPSAVDSAYHEISKALAGTPGLLSNELLRSTAATEHFVILSEWESLAAFRAWEAGPDHREITAPLRPYMNAQGGAAFGIYEVTATY